MKRIVFLAMVLACGTIECRAQEVRPASEFKFQEIFATRSGDSRTYILLGGGWLRVIQFGRPGQFISTWLEQHPAAIVKPVSHQFMTNTRSRKTEEMVYIWVEDGEMSLNVDLVRTGIFPGGVMADMVDNMKGLNEALKLPKLADARAQVEKERAEAPQDITERLMADDEYQRGARRIRLAESEARAERLGIWSDSMKEEREADGYPELR